MADHMTGLEWFNWFESFESFGSLNTYFSRQARLAGKGLKFLFFI